MNAELKKTYKNLKNVEVTRVAILTDGLPPAHQPHKDASDEQKQYLGAFGIFSKSVNPNDAYKDLLDKHFKLNDVEVTVEETSLDDKDMILKGWYEQGNLIKFRRPQVMWRDEKGKFLRIALLDAAKQEEPAINVTTSGDNLVEVAFDKSKFNQSQAKEWLQTHAITIEKGELDSMNEKEIQDLVQKTVDSALTKLVDDVNLLKAEDDDETDDDIDETEEDLKSKAKPKKAKTEKSSDMQPEDIAKMLSETVTKALEPIRADIEVLKKGKMKKSSQQETSPEQIRKAFEEKGQVDLGDGRTLVKENMWSNIPALAPYDCKVVKTGAKNDISNEQIVSALGKILFKEVNANV
uniref:Uncharacterized protein n=1 Tax=viral metagenome TaxID=1070528 RepID=A0A6M3KA42_9ZZZZ